MGVILIIVIPIRNPVLLNNHQLDVIATGEMNLQGTGSRVQVEYLVRIHTDNSIEKLYINLGKDQLGEHAGVPRNSNESVVFHWNDTLWGDVNLKLGLVQGPMSGAASVVWNGRSQYVDLYTPSKPAEVITLDLVKPVKAGFFSTILFSILAAMILGFWVFILGVWLSTRTLPAQGSMRLSPMIWLIYSVPCVIVFSIYLYVFWPGLTTFDTGMQWKEVLKFEFTNRNPFFHTFNIWLITRLWNSLAIVTIVQVLGISLLVGWGGAVLRRIGAPRIAVWVACVIIAILPYTGFLTITVWKDIFYGLSFFALNLILLKMVFSNGDFLKGPKGLAVSILLGLVTALVALYRHNGPPAAFGTLIILLFAYRSYWKKLLISLGVALTLWLLIIGPLASLIGVERVKGKLVSNRLLHKISAHIHAGTELTEEEKEFLSKIPYFIEVSRSPLYSCSSNQPIKHFIKNKTGTLPKDFPAAEEPMKVLRIFLSLTARNPFVTLNSYICATSWMWRIFDNYKRFNYWGPIALFDQLEQQRYMQTRGNDDSLKPELRYFLVKLKRTLYENDFLRCIFLNATLYLYLFIFALVICACRRNSWKIILISSPVILHTTTLFLVISHPGFRYQWPVYLVSLFLFFPLLCVPRSSDDSQSNLNN